MIYGGIRAIKLMAYLKYTKVACKRNIYKYKENV